MSVSNIIKSNKTVLKEYAKKSRGEFVEGTFGKFDCVKIEKDGRVYQLRYIRYTDGKTSRYVTEFSSILEGTGEFQFSIKNNNFLKRALKRAGLMKDIQLNDKDLREQYHFNTNCKERIEKILNVSRIRELMKEQKKMNISLKTNKDGTSSLRFKEGGLVKDFDRLDDIFHIIKEVAVNI